MADLLLLRFYFTKGALRIVKKLQWATLPKRLYFSRSTEVVTGIEEFYARCPRITISVFPPAYKISATYTTDASANALENATRDQVGIGNNSLS